MAVFGRAKTTSLRQFLPLRHGIPSHDTFSRVFRTVQSLFGNIGGDASNPFAGAGGSTSGDASSGSGGTANSNYTYDFSALGQKDAGSSSSNPFAGSSLGQ